MRYEEEVLFNWLVFIWFVSEKLQKTVLILHAFSIHSTLTKCAKNGDGNNYLLELSVLLLSIKLILFPPAQVSEKILEQIKRLTILNPFRDRFVACPFPFLVKIALHCQFSILGKKLLGNYVEFCLFFHSYFYL